jgi:signal transduction histidine kinase
MASSDRMWGAIEVLNRIDGRPFTAADQELCETISGQAAIAIENAMLHESLLAKERLAAFGTAVAGLAHCVRNVLTSIEGGHFLIEQGLEKDNLGPVKQGWQIVSRNARLMHDLVLDMLSYAKEARPEYQLADINRLVSDTISGIGSKLQREGVTVSWAPDDGLPEVEIDRTAVQRCLLNLVTNAAQAIDGIENAEIRVRTRRVDDTCFAIEVTDNGRGIEPENIDKIFQPFFTTKGSKGTGLGLPVVKKLIEQHGGSISVDSEPGKGTRFTMTLPVTHGSSSTLPIREPAASAACPVQPNRADDAPSSDAAPEGSSATDSILIIDDDPDIQAILSASLEAISDSEYRIDVSADGFDGLEKARRTRPALIVLDLHMPGKDGITTLKEIRALDATAGIPVIVLSGDQGVESLKLDFEHASTPGPHLGMQKPVDPPAFQQAVRSLLALPGAM